MVLLEVVANRVADLEHLPELRLLYLLRCASRRNPSPSSRESTERLERHRNFCPGQETTCSYYDGDRKVRLCPECLDRIRKEPETRKVLLAEGPRGVN